MQTVLFSSLIVAILLLVLPLRVKLWFKVDDKFNSTSKIEFVFTVKKSVNLLSKKPKKVDKIFTRRDVQIALDVIYPEIIDLSLVRGGDNLKRDVELVAVFQIIANAILNIAKKRFGGKYTTIGQIVLGSDNVFSLHSVIWFNLLTLSILGINILINLIKSKITNKKAKIGGKI